MLLSEIRTFDSFGCYQDDWIEREIGRIEHVVTYHWGKFIEPVFDPHGKITDWITSEAVSTGVDITRLAARHVRVYRIKNLAPPVKPDQIIQFHSEFGALPYNYIVLARTAFWYICKYYLKKIVPFNLDIRKGFICVGWCGFMDSQFGYQTVPDDEPATEWVLENSPLYKYIGDVNM